MMALLPPTPPGSLLKQDLHSLPEGKVSIVTVHSVGQQTRPAIVVAAGMHEHTRKTLHHSQSHTVAHTSHTCAQCFLNDAAGVS